MSFSPMERKKKAGSASKPNPGEAVASIKYPAKRKNIPPAGLEAQGVLRKEPRIHYEYNPHLPTVLRSATNAAEADNLPALLARRPRAGGRFPLMRLICWRMRCGDMNLGWSGVASERSPGSRSTRCRFTCTSEFRRRRFCACWREKISSVICLPSLASGNPLRWL
jgi:hypothetical protein